VRSSSVLRAARKLLSRQPHMLDDHSRARLAELLERHPRFETVLRYRNELKSLWEGAHTSNERLLADFREWCARAEQSGIQGLQDFVAYLRSFRKMRESALA
jgi:stearoyl-CoA desaturase (delta-9 desaturase)